MRFLLVILAIHYEGLGVLVIPSNQFSVIRASSVLSMMFSATFSSWGCRSRRSNCRINRVLSFSLVPNTYKGILFVGPREILDTKKRMVDWLFPFCTFIKTNNSTLLASTGNLEKDLENHLKEIRSY